MEDKFVKPDKFYEIPFSDGENEYEFVVNAKFDTIHVQRELGIWILKILDDKEGLVQVIMEEPQARKLAEFAMLPVVERPFLYKSEHELWLDAMAERLDQIFGNE